jgi:transferase CAF17, mitochondrial
MDEVEMFESEEFPGCFETDVAAFVDPRTGSNGVRVLCTEESFEAEENTVILKDPKEQYDTTRMILGLPESSSELGGQFPLNLNLHFMNGVSFDKGCYIGQELTQRTYHTGVIRRMALPFVINTTLKGGDKDGQKLILDP